MPARKRRAPGGGSVYKTKAGDYRAALWVTQADGTRKRHWRTAQTEREARAKLDDLHRQLERGELTGTLPARWTVGAYLAYWLDHAVTGTVRQSTADTYGAAVKAAQHALGAVALSDLAPAHIDRYLADLRAVRSAATTSLYRTVLRAALAHAQNRGYLSRNPAAGIRAPRKAHQALARPVLSTEEALALVTSARHSGDSYWPLWALLLATGLRRGEALGLEWRDIDEGAHILRVERQYREKYGLGPVKADRSARLLPLIPLALDALSAQRDLQARQRHLAPVWQETGAVFTRPGGGRLSPDSLAPRLAAALKVAGLPRATPHALRHSTASIWLRAGVPLKVASELLGHSSVSITADVYTHTDLTVLRATAETITAHFAAVAAAQAAALGAPLQIDQPARE